MKPLMKMLVSGGCLPKDRHHITTGAFVSNARGERILTKLSQEKEAGKQAK